MNCDALNASFSKYVTTVFTVSWESSYPLRLSLAKLRGKNKCLTFTQSSCFFQQSTEKKKVVQKKAYFKFLTWPYGVVASIGDSESLDPSSNLGKALIFIFFLVF